MKRFNAIIPYLSRMQVEDVIKLADNLRDKAMFATMYQCGLRRSEVQYLRRQDWYPSQSMYGMIRIWRVKTEEGLVPDEKPIWGRTSNILKEYLETREDESDALFLSRKGRPMGPQAVYTAFKKAAKLARLPVSLSHPHVLRHSIATHQSNMGASFSDIQSWLGHRSISSTMRYAQVLNPRKKDLVLRSESSPYFAKY